MERYQCPFQTHNVLSEGNMTNISKTIPINISIDKGIIENINIGANWSLEEITQYTALFKEFCDVLTWSYEEILGIDPIIVEHEIKTYPNVKLVWQKLRPLNPNKSTAMKVEVENLLKAGFIYPVSLTEWVSNLVSVNTKSVLTLGI